MKGGFELGATRIDLYYPIIPWIGVMTLGYLFGAFSDDAHLPSAEPGRGFGLPAIYATWIGALLILYPACRWFAALKQRRRDVWLSYL